MEMNPTQVKEVERVALIIKKHLKGKISIKEAIGIAYDIIAAQDKAKYES